MPRPRKAVVLPALTAGQASFVVERLIQDRRLSPREVSGYLTELAVEIRDLEVRIATLRNAAGTPAEAPRTHRGPGRPKRRRAGRRGNPAMSGEILPPVVPDSKPVRKRRRITPAQRAANQLQGRYIGYLRQIPAARRGFYQQIYLARGVEAAIAALRADLGK